MYCFKCGKQIQEDDEFCLHCEEQLNAAHNTNVPKKGFSADESSIDKSNKRTKGNRVPILFGAVVVLIVVIVLITTVITPAISNKPSNDDEANNSANTLNYNDEKPKGSDITETSSQDAAHLPVTSSSEKSNDLSAPSFENRALYEEVLDINRAPYESDMALELRRENIESKENMVPSEYNEGIIISQSVEVSARLGTDEMDAKEFEVSEGPKPERITVPSYYSIDYREVESDLMAMGLRSEIIDEISTAVAEGSVIRTEPAAGTEIEVGSRIIIFRSLGQGVVRTAVPNLISMNYNDAKRAIENSGFVIGLTFPDAYIEANEVVIMQSPDAGTQADAGVEIDLWFGKPDNAEDGTSASTLSPLAIHTVASGETLPRIAQRYYGSSKKEYIDLIIQANGLTSDAILINQTLTIPPKPASSDQETIIPSQQPSTTPVPTSAQAPITPTEQEIASANGSYSYHDDDYSEWNENSLMLTSIFIVFAYYRAVPF